MRFRKRGGAILGLDKRGLKGGEGWFQGLSGGGEG